MLWDFTIFFDHEWRIEKKYGIFYHGGQNSVFFSENIVKSQTSWYSVGSYLELWIEKW